MSDYTKLISLGGKALREFSKCALVKLYSTSKSNQIDVLRKRYEALLQEDKKRKERNDYILQKMDNMRTCTALTFTKHRSIVQENVSGLLPTSNNLVALGARASNESQLYQYYHDKIPRLSGNGTAVSLLRDIYKKYILIPKRLPSEEENPGQCHNSNVDTKAPAPVTTSTEINSDWTRKYEILNKLKQEEKEIIGSDSADSVKSEYQEKYAYPNEPISQYEPEILVKDISNTMKLNDKSDGNKRGNDSNTKHGENDKEKGESFKDLRSPHLMAAAGLDSDKNIKEEVPLASGETHPYPFTNMEGREKIEYLDDEGINPAHISYPCENLGKPFGDVPDFTEDVQYPIDVINVEEFTPKPDVVVKDGVNVNPEEYGLNKTHFQPLSSHKEDEKDDVIKDKADHIHPEEYDTSRKHFEPVLTHEVEEDKPDTSSKIEKVKPSKQPDNPEMTLVSEEYSSDPQIVQSTQMYSTHQTVPVPENMEDLGKPSVELGADEEEIYYPEPISEIAYNQTPAAGDNWDSTQNENLQQNEQYYYQGPHEMPESVHINEHEETSTPYDQNYEQQYNMANHGQQEYDEISQQYDPPQGGYDVPLVYESQLEYDQSGQAGFEQSGQAVYDQSGQAAYDQSGQAVYEQSGQAIYDQSEHATYEQHAPMEQYNPEPEYDEQLFQQEKYDTVQHIEEQLNQEEGYIATQNEQEQVLNVESQQQPVA